ncbi:MAG: hypothetical protein NVSMB38_30580 [Ktedonobacteraceae bacterium]
MKTVRTFSHVTQHFYRPEQSFCPECKSHLRRAVTLSERTVITLQGAIKVVHAGYRCPNPTCGARRRTYRSTQADNLALPSFTFGLDIVLLVGQLRLSQHQTIDEAHQSLLERLAPFGMRVCRREILYLFDAYCTLLRAGTEVQKDSAWIEHVKANEGIIVSMDGIQPDRGNETIYLVRDALTGRVLAAENVTCSEIVVLKQILAPVKALDVPILGTISDAQESLLKALEQTWPEAPHQVCQFHALQDASRPAYEVDRKIKTAMRKLLQPKLKDVRQQLERHSKQTTSSEETEQLAVLNDYALGIQTALHFDGTVPFDYPAVAAAEALDEIEASLCRLEKKGDLEAWLVNRNSLGCNNWLPCGVPGQSKSSR